MKIITSSHIDTLQLTHYLATAMIERVSGKLITCDDTSAVVDVGGVGFILSIPTIIAQELPQPSADVTLLTHFHVREDDLTLFGFSTEEQRIVFRLLLKVSGVGPKLALAALSMLTPGVIIGALSNEDVQIITKISGVGPKLAKRITMELRDEAKKLTAKIKTHVVSSNLNEATEALIALGFHPDKIYKVLNELEPKFKDKSVSDLVREALSILSR